MSEDPIRGLPSMPQTLNPYTYGWNNPFVYPDPSGLWALTVDIGAGPHLRAQLGFDIDYDKPFVVVAAGGGVGAGLKFDPTAGFPKSKGYDPLSSSDPCWAEYGGTVAEASVGLGPYGVSEGYRDYNASTLINYHAGGVERYYDVGGPLVKPKPWSWNDLKNLGQKPLRLGGSVRYDREAGYLLPWPNRK